MEMASREQREALARAGMEAFNQGDIPRMLASLSDDVEVYASPEMANAGRYTGHDAFVAWITTWIDAWEQVTAEVTGSTPVGDRHIVTAIHQEGRGREGIELAMELAFLFDVEDEGKCTYMAMVPSEEEAVSLAREREGLPS
jgi:ketosteroid isomerase-like protein